MVPTSKEIYRLVTGHIKHFLPFSHILVLQKGQWQTCMFITVMRVWTAQFMCQAIVGCCLELTDTLGCWLILTKNAICHHMFSKPKYLETANTTPITERLICARQRMRFKKKNPYVKYYDDEGSKISSSPAALVTRLSFHPEHLLEHYF